MEVLADTLVTVPLLLDGLATTLVICGVAMGVALGLAVLLVAAARSGVGVLVAGVRAWVALMRGLPIVIMLFLLYFGLPAVLDLGRLSAFWVGVLALGLNGGAFVSEVLRAAIDRVPQGQWEAARALGLPRPVLWLRVILPQMLPIALPALVGEMTFLVKASPALSLITVVDLTRRSQQIAMQTFDPLAPMLAAALMYFAMLYPLSMLARRIGAQVRPQAGPR